MAHFLLHRIDRDVCFHGQISWTSIAGHSLAFLEHALAEENAN